MSAGPRIDDLLVEKGLTISVCESCTGGMLAATITNIPGSSRYFLGGIIAYSDKVKKKVVGVRVGTLERHGAVSAQTAKEMAQATKQKMKSDIGVAVTGVAGPAGGTAKKPVGMVYIAVACRGKTIVRKFLFSGGRQAVRRSSVKNALAMVREILCAA
jgi:PncC family amidohydrolase